MPVDRRMMEVGAGAAATQGLSINVNEVPFAAGPMWWLASDGTVVSGLPDSYRFEMRHPDGTVTVVEREWQPVAVNPDEARWYRARLTFFWRGLIPEFIWTGAEIPDEKRPYLELMPDESGRVWTLREIEGQRLADCDPDPAEFAGFIERPCWSQPYVMEAFGADGRFLGQVSLPDGMRRDVHPYIRDDLVVAVFEDDAGTITVKRFRLIVEEGR